MSDKGPDYDDNIARRWMSLLPNLTIGQYAGNIGFLSAGIGWDYGKHNSWETHLLVGYLPHFTFDDDCATITLRQLYLPWEVATHSQLSFSPAVFSLTVNTVSSKEFWITEPISNGYYSFSTKIRFLLGLGSRINIYLDDKKRGRDCHVSLYYDVSLSDLEVLSYLRNDNKRLKDILALGLGIVYHFY